jgi:hypothetical protein
VSSVKIAVVTVTKEAKRSARQSRDKVLHSLSPFVEDSLAAIDRILFPPKVYAKGTRGARRSSARAIFNSMTPEQRDAYFFQMAEIRLQSQCNELGYRATVDLASTNPHLPLSSRCVSPPSPSPTFWSLHPIADSMRISGSPRHDGPRGCRRSRWRNLKKRTRWHASANFKCMSHLR